MLASRHPQGNSFQLKSRKKFCAAKLGRARVALRKFTFLECHLGKGWRVLGVRKSIFISVGIYIATVLAFSVLDPVYKSSFLSYPSLNIAGYAGLFLIAYLAGLIVSGGIYLVSKISGRKETFPLGLSVAICIILQIGLGFWSASVNEDICSNATLRKQVPQLDSGLCSNPNNFRIFGEIRTP